MHITGIYAALATLLVVILAFRVIVLRQSTRTGIGDGGDIVETGVLELAQGLDLMAFDHAPVDDKSI